MFPTRSDFHFWMTQNKPKWYKGETGLTSISIDQLVNAHAGIKIPNYIHNTFSLFKLWRENRKNEPTQPTPLEFMRYIVSSGKSNQEARYKFCYRVIRKLLLKNGIKTIDIIP